MSPSPLYQPGDWLLVRAPRLPADGYGATKDADDPDVRLAIAVASPSLLGALARPSDAARTARKVMRYRIRMATRPTPYGMFAGVAMGRFADRTDLGLSGEPVRARTRVDMDWLMRLVAAQEAVPEVRRRLRLVANPAAFERAGRMWLSERASVEHDGPQSGVSVLATDPVRRALAAARRPVPYAGLHALVVEATGAPDEKVEGLLGELWRQTFLFTDLRPPLTTDDPLGHVLARLPEGPAAEGLLQVRAAAARFDAAPAPDREAAWRDLVAASAVHPGDPPQVDMALPLSGCGVSRRVGTEAARAAELLLRLTPWPSGPPYLAAYREAFEARYPDGRQVPVLELVDPDHGLGPPVSYWARDSPVPPARAARRAQAQTDIALGALRDGTLVVTLDADAVDRLETWPPSPAGAPPSLEVNAFVAASSVAALDAGDFRLVVGPNVGGSSAGKSLGRFADLLGPRAIAALASSAQAEQVSAPDRIWTGSGRSWCIAHAGSGWPTWPCGRPCAATRSS